MITKLLKSTEHILQIVENFEMLKKTNFAYNYAFLELKTIQLSLAQNVDNYRALFCLQQEFIQYCIEAINVPGMNMFHNLKVKKL